MEKIAIVGGPSSGKTTTALLLCYQLKMMGCEVHFLLEYATNYIIRNGAPRHVFEQLAIFHGQKDEEEYIEAHNRNRGGGIDYLVCDSATFLAAVYARHCRPEDENKEGIQKYNFALKTLDKWSREKMFKTYDYIFLLSPEIPFKKNNIRWQTDEQEARKIATEIESYLIVEGRSYWKISGSPKERVRKIIQVLKQTKEEENSKPSLNK